MKSIIRNLPKVELHLHLDGSLRVDTVFELAQQGGIDLPVSDSSELKRYLEVGQDCESLKDYLNKFNLPLQVLQQSQAALARVVFELIEDCAKENIKYVEIRFSPLILTENFAKEEVVEAVLAGISAGEQEYNIEANLILSCMRHHSPAKSLEVVDLAIKYQDKGVVAVDLAGNEADFSPELHQKAFELAYQAGLHRTVHAGEAAGAKSVKSAINILKAERIGHGVNSNQDQELMDYLLTHQIPLEVCPTSNLQTKTVSDIKLHPLKEYYDLGIPITINTDNRRVSNISLTDEYLILYQELGFSLDEIKNIILMGVDSAFILADEKKQLSNSFIKCFQDMGC